MNLVFLLELYFFRAIGKLMNFYFSFRKIPNKNELMKQNEITSFAIYFWQSKYSSDVFPSPFLGFLHPAEYVLLFVPRPVPNSNAR